MQPALQRCARFGPCAMHPHPDAAARLARGVLQERCRRHRRRTHMEERRPRERELVLAPNEYAYILDTTKGHINSYVGPNKTSLAQTDQPVIFNALTKPFDSAAEIQDGWQLSATAPAGFYMVLKNPAKDGAH